MKTILHISRLHQHELLSILKIAPDEIDITNQFITTGYKIINPDDEPTDDRHSRSRITPRDVTVEEYQAEVAAYDEKHAGDPSAPGIKIIQIYTKENLLTSDIVDNIEIIETSVVPKNIATAGYDLIVVGICDTGVDIFKKCEESNQMPPFDSEQYSQFQALSNARDAGIPIIFTHDCLEINTFCEPFPDDYDQLIGNFGVLEYKHNFLDASGQPTTSDDVKQINCLVPDHAIMHSYFDLLSTLDVQPTHHGGIVLKPEAQVIYTNAESTPANSNYYLAVYEEAGKGKVVNCIMGHCFGNHNQFYRPSNDECKILLNTIVWLLS